MISIRSWGHPKSQARPARSYCRAVLAVFSIPHPPVTQLGVLKWAQENGRLGKLQEEALAAVKKGIGRWSGKWQGALRKEVAELPEEILLALKPLPSGSAPGSEREHAASEERQADPEANESMGEQGEAVGEAEPGHEHCGGGDEAVMQFVLPRGEGGQASWEFFGGGTEEAALFRPRTGYYADLIAEASALWESLSQNHPHRPLSGRTGGMIGNFVPAAKLDLAWPALIKKIYLIAGERGPFR